MKEFVRILFFQPVPKLICEWLANRDYDDWVSTGTSGENFQVIDLLFEHEEDAVQFKLTFPDVVMTAEEVKLTNAKVNWPEAVGSKKAALHDRLLNVYQAMHDEEPDE